MIRVSSVDSLNYKMIDRKRFTGMNPGRILRLLKVSATSALIEKKILGLSKYLDRVNEKQKDFDEEIAELSMNTWFTDMKVKYV